jgi:malto-oligosyltrehalose trehalohydrolase
MTQLGALTDEDGTRFVVWAPKAIRVDVLKLNEGRRQVFSLEKTGHGYFESRRLPFQHGDLYKFVLDGETELPDPASRYQPEGPHGPSQVVSPDYPWKDRNWHGIPLNELVVYELHVGTFSEEGSFKGIEKKIPHFKKLGANCLEIMPIAQFAGSRNWGYDGVGLYAPQNNYGRHRESYNELKDLINACHQNGIAVILDVVYNHLGPEGNYLSKFGNYFSDTEKNGWGDALNFDGPAHKQVRNYFLENARYWLEEFHFDGLRLDAVHAIVDKSEHPFLSELGGCANALQKKLHRQIHIIAESETNDPVILKPPYEQGWGLTAQWADDLHHVVHTLLTGESQGYYADFGELRQLAKAYQRGLVFEGEYSKNKKAPRGKSYCGISRTRFVVCTQNHDQTGNRCEGERLITLVGPEKARMAAATVFFSGAMPMLFMGEEWGARNPFLYFVDHSDPELRSAVCEGRKKEFSAFGFENVPDPADEATFKRSMLDWEKAEESEGLEFTKYYQRLIELSRWIRKQQYFEGENVDVTLDEQNKVLEVLAHKSTEAVTEDLWVCFNFSDSARAIKTLKEPGLEVLFDSHQGSGQPLKISYTEISAFTVLLARRSRKETH